MKPDVIVCWPDNCDYPLWRKFIKKNRFRFNKVYVIFTKTNRAPIYNSFVANDLIGVCDLYYSPAIYPNQDWRDIAVNFALDLSKAEWVWFTEQDFLILDNSFWEDVENQVNEGKSAISYYDAYRMHPCCIFARRSMVEKTTKNFGIVKDKLDHFGVFQQEVDELYLHNRIEIGAVKYDSCKHLNGLSSNFSLISNGDKPNYRPDEFRKFIIECLNSGMELDYNFKDICLKYLNQK